MRIYSKQNRLVRTNVYTHTLEHSLKKGGCILVKEFGVIGSCHIVMVSYATKSFKLT